MGMAVITGTIMCMEMGESGGLVGVGNSLGEYRGVRVGVVDFRAGWSWGMAMGVSVVARNWHHWHR